MATARVPVRKCITPRCHRHVHGLAVSKGILHCRTCGNELKYAGHVATGREVGRVLVKLLWGARV